MRLTLYIQIIFLTILFSSCSSFKKSLVKNGGIEDAIQNSILNFSNSSLFNKGSVFYITPYDSIFKMVLKKVDEGNYEYVKGEYIKDVYGISISTNYNKFLYTERVKVGSKGELPSRAITIDGKLFYWWDDEYSLTREVLDLFERYNLLQDDEGGLITIPDFTTDDSQKGADYYFCKNDLTRYKRVISSKALGYYDPPNRICE